MQHISCFTNWGKSSAKIAEQMIADIFDTIVSSVVTEKGNLRPLSD